MQTGRLRAHHHPAAGEGAHRVGPVVAEGARDLVEDDVAQHAAEDRRDHAHQHGDDRRHVLRQRELRAAGAEQAQAQRVGPLHRPFGGLEVACAQNEHRGDAQRQQRPQPVGMLHPEERPPVEQHVAQRAAAEGGEPGDHAHAHRVEPLARRLEQARQREGDGGQRLHRRQQQRIQRRVGQGCDAHSARPTTASTNTPVPSPRFSATRWRMALSCAAALGHSRAATARCSRG